MTYAIVKMSNGSFSIAEEGFTDLDRAKSRFHAICSSLWNASDVEKACVALVDEQLNIVDGKYYEFINKEVAPVISESVA